ncbi:hypothetical protein A3860_02425 [Niastella vici]|uniref:Restriction endonuclease type IV Mrr domain-containing protein n=1 Tax=Niastella vici TaxID=1703345 RepID=A0A1V9G9B6_9BACT|nr:restriction endonuclease [Niastella vici]OQP67235.1 hypothetical protein A3860_02425 [Niastella vici]
MKKMPDNIEISPEEFEKLVHEYLLEAGKGLKKFEAVHDVKMQAHDGTYQIDIKATFEAINCDIVILIECKRHSAPIKREIVQVLNDKVRSLGAHKGILFSTSPFQGGAKTYAQEHGIATVQLIEGRFTYVTKAAGEQEFNPPFWANIPKYVGQFEYASGSYYLLQPGYIDKLSEFIFIDGKEYQKN